MVTPLESQAACRFSRVRVQGGGVHLGSGNETSLVTTF